MVDTNTTCRCEVSQTIVGSIALHAQVHQRSSHAGNPGSTITQLAFSPRENLIAWSDSDGVFSRWVKPIADTLCDPVKHSISTNAAATTISKPRTEINLFGEDLTDTRLAVEDDFADVDLDHDMYDEDFVIDDLLTRDEPAVSKSYDPFVKEMGTNRVRLKSHSYSTLASSEHRQSPTTISTGMHSNGEQKAIFRSGGHLS